MSRITLLDGGMGKALFEAGAPFRQPEWSALALMEAPEWVEQVHGAFIDAGAQVITTNNYAVVPFHIGEQRFADEGQRLVGLAGELARRAAEHSKHRVMVAGSIPPLFGSYQPERFDPQRAPAMLADIAAALDPWVDLFLAETQSSVAEARASAAAVAEYGKPVWLAASLRDEVPVADGPGCLRSGESITAFVEMAVEVGAAAVLFNCSRPEVMETAVREAVSVLEAVSGAGSKVAVGVYANAFEPVSARGAANEVLSEHRHDLESGRWPDFVTAWLAAGATIVGGCCGVMPRHLVEIGETVAQYQNTFEG